MKEHLDEKAMREYAEILIGKLTEMKESNWEKPWISSKNHVYPQNLNGRHYAVNNALMLLMHQEKHNWELPIYMTFRQVQEKGLLISKGAKSFPVSFWKKYIKDENGKEITEDEFNKKTDEEQKKCKVNAYLKYYNVFNIEQTNVKEARPEMWAALLDKHSTNKRQLDESKMFKCPELDNLIENKAWLCNIRLVKDSEKAYYTRNGDYIVMPEKKQFVDGESFYGTLLHEMTHSTGAPDRLNRTKGAVFGDANYGREELVAEFSSAMAAINLGINKNIKDESIQYIKAWLDSIEQDPKFLISVISDSSKAVNMINSYILANTENIKKSENRDNYYYNNFISFKNDLNDGMFNSFQMIGRGDGIKFIDKEGWNKIIESGEKQNLIDFVNKMDYTNNPEFSSTYKSPLQNENEEIIAENDKYVVTNYGEFHDYYSFYRKHSLNEINESLELYGLLENPTNDIIQHAILRYKENKDFVHKHDWDYLEKQIIHENKTSDKKEYQYRLILRPFSIGTQPDGHLRYEEDGSIYGSVIYDHPLDEKDVRNFSLRPITEAKNLNGKLFEVPFGNDILKFKVKNVDDDGFIEFSINDKYEKIMNYYDFLKEMGKDAKEIKDEKNINNPEKDIYYFSVAYLQYGEDVEEIQKLIDKGDYAGTLNFADFIDHGEDLEQSLIKKSPIAYPGDILINENNKYAIVLNNTVGGTYEIFRKVTKNDIEQNILRYGLDSKASSEVKDIAQNMQEQEKNKEEEKLLIDNIYDSIAKKIEKGKISIREASLTLYKAGFFNYIPSLERTLESINEYLKINNRELIDSNLLLKEKSMSLKDNNDIKAEKEVKDKNSTLEKIKNHIDNVLKNKSDKYKIETLVHSLSDKDLKAAQKYSEKRSGRSKIVKQEINSIRNLIISEIKRREGRANQGLEDKELVVVPNKDGIGFKEEGDKEIGALINVNREIFFINNKQFSNKNLHSIDVMAKEGNMIVKDDKEHLVLALNPLNEPSKIYENQSDYKRFYLSIESFNGESYAVNGREIIFQGKENIIQLMDNSPENEERLNSAAEMMLNFKTRQLKQAYETKDSLFIEKAKSEYIDAEKCKYQNDFSLDKAIENINFIEAEVEEKQKNNMEQKDFISVFKMKNGMYGVNETTNGVRSATRLLSTEDAQSYFAGLKGQPREEVMRRREILAEKYLRNNKQEQKAVEKNEKRLPPISNETKERISNVSVFKMQDGISYAVRAKIDGEQLSGKRVNREDIACFFDGYKGMVKEDQEERKAQLAALYFKENLDVKKEDVEETKRLHI